VIETEAADDPKTLPQLLPQSCDLLVVDSYRLGREYESALADFARQRLVIEDLPDRAHETEFLLDQTLGRTPDAYRGLLSPDTRLLLGPGYALLRPEFAAARRQAVRRHVDAGSFATLLVALGGAPAPDILDLVLAGVGEAELSLAVHLVAGGTVAEGNISPARLVSHDRTSDMHRLMAECDVALGAGGGSAWERCCLGLPSLIIQVADNQKDVAAGLDAAGAAIDLGPASGLSSSAIARALRGLADDPERRAAMAGRASRVCDGLGVRRVCGVLAPQRSGDGAAVTLRPVREDDARLLFEWQQIPQIRRYANEARPPTWDGHSAWFRRRLDEPLAGPFSMIMNDGKEAGVLRFDAPIPARIVPIGNPAREGFVVSILTVPQLQGKGIARAALAAGRDLLPDATFYAEVLEGNEASHRLFSNANYQRIQPNLYISEP
jgi:UDP-2,4-diacetamido-2,4,6-trideoxy-beta-L-altropyranose hydrolase